MVWSDSKRDSLRVFSTLMLGVPFAALGCSNDTASSTLEPTRQNSSGRDGRPERIRVACVGDSITYGAGISDREHESYPSQLGRMLGEAWDVRNFGHSGTTALRNTYRPYWSVSEFAAATQFDPHLVIIQLGTNDASPPIWNEQKGQFATDYGDLIEHFGGLPSRPQVWACLPVPIYPGAAWPGHEERRLNLAQEVIPLIRDVAAAKGVLVIDLFRPLSDHPGLFPDTVHPDAEGASLIAREVRRLLKERTTGPDS